MKLKILWAVLFLTPAAWAQKNMNEARPEIRQLLSEQTAKFWTDVQVDTAWNRAQTQIGLLSGILIQKFATIRTLRDTAQLGAEAGNGFGSYGYLLDTLTSKPFRLRSVFVDSGVRQPFYLTIVDNPGSIPYLSGQTQPTYCYLHDSILIIYPKASAQERLQVTYHRQPMPLGSASTVTDLPFILHPAAVWLAASFLMNQDYKYEVSDRYYKRAIDLITAYKAAFQMQTEPIRGSGAK